MKLFNVFFLTSILFILSGCSSSMKVIESSGVKDTPTTHFDEKSQISYSISNDDKNIYLSLRSKKSSTIKKMLRTGFVISFFGTEKKKELSKLNYPLLKKGSKLTSNEVKVVNSGTDLPLHSVVQDYLDNKNDGMFNEEKFSAEDNLRGVKARLDFNVEAGLIYDVAIPFKELSNMGKSSLEQLRIVMNTGVFKEVPVGTISGKRTIRVTSSEARTLSNQTRSRASIPKSVSMTEFTTKSKIEFLVNLK